MIFQKNILLAHFSKTPDQFFNLKTHCKCKQCYLQHTECVYKNILKRNTCLSSLYKNLNFCCFNMTSLENRRKIDLPDPKSWYLIQFWISIPLSDLKIFQNVSKKSFYKKKSAYISTFIIYYRCIVEVRAPYKSVWI